MRLNCTSSSQNFAPCPFFSNLTVQNFKLVQLNQVKFVKCTTSTYYFNPHLNLFCLNFVVVLVAPKEGSTAASEASAVAMVQGQQLAATRRRWAGHCRSRAAGGTAMPAGGSATHTH